MPRSFFIPDASEDQQEAVYAEYADVCGIPVPKPEARVYSIVYMHDRIEWTATVGERPRGVESIRTGPKHAKVERERPHRRPAVVKAILPGPCYFLVTDGADSPLPWHNPARAGVPKRVVLFSEAESE